MYEYALFFWNLKQIQNQWWKRIRKPIIQPVGMLLLIPQEEPWASNGIHIKKKTKKEQKKNRTALHMQIVD